MNELKEVGFLVLLLSVFLYIESVEDDELLLLEFAVFRDRVRRVDGKVLLKGYINKS